MSKTQKYEEMFALVKAWENSGMDRSTYCKEHGISIATFSYWRTKYKKSLQPETPFLELQPESVIKLEVIYPNGVRVLLPKGSSMNTLRSLVSLI